MPAASEPIAVNTGPLIALAASDDLDLLRHLHARVLVPQAVDEYGRGVHRAPGGDLPAWFKVHTLAAPVPPVLTAHLDLGEACAIALALERGLGLVATLNYEIDRGSPAATAHRHFESAHVLRGRRRVQPLVRQHPVLVVCRM